MDRHEMIDQARAALSEAVNAAISDAEQDLAQLAGLAKAATWLESEGLALGVAQRVRSELEQANNDNRPLSGIDLAHAAEALAILKTI